MNTSSMKKDLNGSTLTIAMNRVIVYMRKGKKSNENILVIFNMTPVKRENWKIKAHDKKEWNIIFNSDEKRFWGAGHLDGHLYNHLVDKKSSSYEINLHLPALAAIVLRIESV